MTEITNEVLDAMVEAVVGAVSPEQVVLFGSCAEGGAQTASDVDLLVVEAEPFGPGRSRRQEIGRIRRALSGFRVPKDILLYSTHEVEKWRHSLNHVVARCLRDGKVVYERR